MNKKHLDVPSKFAERMQVALAVIFFVGIALSLPPSWTHLGDALAGSLIFVVLWFWLRRVRLSAQFRADNPGYTSSRNR
jgi:hypothetical protein